MTGALAVLAADHERILELANWLTGGAGDPPAEPGKRQHVAKQLVMEVSRHDAVEELLFWPLVRKRLPGGADLARPALEQEGGAKRLLHELGHMSPGDEDFRTLCFHVQSHLRDHITYEQNQIWPKLQLHAPADELERVGGQLEQAKRAAPTRPHPHLPADPTLLSTVGTAVAFVDRARCGHPARAAAHLGRRAGRAGGGAAPAPRRPLLTPTAVGGSAPNHRMPVRRPSPPARTYRSMMSLASATNRAGRGRSGRGGGARRRPSGPACPRPSPARPRRAGRRGGARTRWRVFADTASGTPAPSSNRHPETRPVDDNEPVAAVSGA